MASDQVGKNPHAAMVKIPYTTLAKYLCSDKSKRKVVGCGVGPASLLDGGARQFVADVVRRKDRGNDGMSRRDCIDRRHHRRRCSLPPPAPSPTLTRPSSERRTARSRRGGELGTSHPHATLAATVSHHLRCPRRHRRRRPPAKFKLWLVPRRIPAVVFRVARSPAVGARLRGTLPLSQRGLLHGPLLSVLLGSSLTAGHKRRQEQLW